MSMHKAKAVVEPMDQYHASGAIGSSMITTIVNESPAHFKYWHLDGNVKEPTPAMKFGALAHMAMLETEIFTEKFVIEREFKGKGSVAAYEEWASSLPNGTIILSQKEYRDISGMVSGLYKHKATKELLKKTGIKEHSFYFTDPVTGLKCKFRPDLLTDDEWIIDIKTAVSSRREKFMRQVRPLGRHITAAFYSYGYEQVFGRKPKGYIFLAIEKTEPYVPSVFVADETVMGPGEQDFRKGLNLIKECMEKDYWPGYQDAPENLSMPHWELYDYD